MKEFYKIKEKGYFNNIREDIISVVPQNAQNKILEIGAGGGDTLVELKKLSKAKVVVGCELMEIPNSNQNNEIINKFIIGDIQCKDLDLELDFFDIIICADVLEHLLDPWDIVNYLTKFLKKGGLFIVSLPNIRNIVPLYKILIKSSFEYDVDSGILDKTHYRFFCKKDILNLMTTTEINPEEYYSSFRLKNFDFSFKTNRTKVLDFLTLGLFRGLLTSQYVVIARKIK